MPEHEAPWQEAPRQITVEPDEIHIWRSELDRPAPWLTASLPLLSDDERARASRFHAALHQNRYITARAALRRVLSRYLDIHPRTIRFTYNRFGKPFLAEPPLPGLQFSVAHSGDLALYAVACCRVGVDIEQMRPDFDLAAIAAQQFSPLEQSTLRGLPAPLQTAAFYACWTRKEAYIKACGLGLYLPLQEFDVTCTPADPPRLLTTAPGESSPEQWSLWNIPLDKDYAGAVAAECRVCRLRYRLLSPPD